MLDSLHIKTCTVFNNVGSSAGNSLCACCCRLGFGYSQSLSSTCQLFATVSAQLGSQPVRVTDETVGETTDANNLQTRSNSAYVTHQLRAQNIKLDKCPAYESVERCRDTS